jgi:hypothetical protein
VLVTALFSVLAPASADPLFATSESCVACHNGLVTSAGQDVSFGTSWRPSMMANSARDPYWQAAVRRESLDHPDARAAIEDECSACHMPMTRYQAKAAGAKGKLFAHLPVGAHGTPDALLAADGVSCSLCHQISPEKLGTAESFSGGFVVEAAGWEGSRKAFGPFAVDRGMARVMRSASGFDPTLATHVQKSELCATCHTLYTKAHGPKGEVVGTLPEQVPYLEWKHSAYRTEKSCQSCHLPTVSEPTPIASVLGAPRAGLSRHAFEGGNFFMLQLLNRYRAQHHLQASPHEMEAASRRAVDHLQSKAATLRVDRLHLEGRVLDAEIVVTNLAGHKLPTAYPSRRAWLHVTVRNARGRILFESGALTTQGSIQGNDNDDDPSRFEPHHAVIDHPSKVQVYEAILVDHVGRVTTGLLSGVRFAKDNRILPRGFDKASAPADVAVRGAAAGDRDFVAAEDRVRYRVSVAEPAGPLHVEAELIYQPVGYRWAQTMRTYRAPEPSRFVKYYDAMAPHSTTVIARAGATWERPREVLAPARAPGGQE